MCEVPRRGYGCSLLGSCRRCDDHFPKNQRLQQICRQCCTTNMSGFYSVCSSVCISVCVALCISVALGEQMVVPAGLSGVRSALLLDTENVHRMRVCPKCIHPGAIGAQAVHLALGQMHGLREARPPSSVGRHSRGKPFSRSLKAPRLRGVDWGEWSKAGGSWSKLLITTVPWHLRPPRAVLRPARALMARVGARRGRRFKGEITMTVTMLCSPGSYPSTGPCPSKGGSNRSSNRSSRRPPGWWRRGRGSGGRRRNPSPTSASRRGARTAISKSVRRAARHFGRILGSRPPRGGTRGGREWDPCWPTFMLAKQREREWQGGLLGPLGPPGTAVSTAVNKAGQITCTQHIFRGVQR